MLYYQMTGFMESDRPKPDDELRLPPPEEAELFVNFDGTLIDIAPTPDAIVIPDGLPALLARAMERLEGRVALITGRDVSVIETLLPDFEGAIIGGHGAQRRLHGETVEIGDFDRDTIATLQRIVAEFTKLQPAFLAENNPTGVVLHYRQAQEHGAEALHFMDSLVQTTSGFCLQPTLCAYEIKPASVTKDKALAELCTHEPFRGKLPVYAGDDLTDEPALRWAEGRGGVAIKVGGAETAASHWIDSPAAFRTLLRAWLD